MAEQSQIHKLNEINDTDYPDDVFSQMMAPTLWGQIVSKKHTLLTPHEKKAIIEEEIERIKCHNEWVFTYMPTGEFIPGTDYIGFYMGDRTMLVPRVEFVEICQNELNILQDASVKKILTNGHTVYELHDILIPDVGYAKSDASAIFHALQWYADADDYRGYVSLGENNDPKKILENVKWYKKSICGGKLTPFSSMKYMKKLCEKNLCTTYESYVVVEVTDGESL